MSLGNQLLFLLSGMQLILLQEILPPLCPGEHW
jgi:hypothetical protein